MRYTCKLTLRAVPRCGSTYSVLLVRMVITYLTCSGLVRSVPYTDKVYVCMYVCTYVPVTHALARYEKNLVG